MTADEKLAAMLHLPMPEGMTRMESGPISFGDDWPGMFVRGDEAAELAWVPVFLEKLFEMHPEIRFSEQIQLLNMTRHLRGFRRCLLIDDKEEK